MARLHVTGDDTEAARIGALVAPEPVLAWRDWLYQGPVPQGLSLGALSEERARFLAGRFRLDLARTLEAFRERDRRLRQAIEQGDTLVLWFGPGLDDQLRLLQLLDLAGQEEAPAALGDPAAQATPAAPAQLALARDAWAAFQAPTPEGLARLLEADTTALPCLGPALERLLEELPTDYPGLSTTERHILEELAPGPLPATELRARCDARGRTRFMADWPFFAVLDELAAEPMPLVAGLPAGGFPFEGGEATQAAYLGSEVRVTHHGMLVREGRLDRALARPLDRWLGGTHLTGDRLWRWEPATASLQPA
jgi:hypothetical protein